MSLAEYIRKRRFGKTPEPAGGKTPKAPESARAAAKITSGRRKKLIFVVHEHHASQLHYDLRLEMNGVLKSWAVPKGPSMDPHDHRLAVHVEDHPYSYRTFEGTIPEGNYGAGEVYIWDSGTYEPRAETDNPEKTLLKELRDGHITFVMHGDKLNGEFALIKTHFDHDGANGDKSWLLIKKGDDYSVHGDAPEQTSAQAAERDELKAQPKTKLPTSVKPMLATLIQEPFSNVDWLYEIKWDGYRAIGAWDGREVQLYSRNGLDFRDRFVAVQEVLTGARHQFVLDGEIVALDESGYAHFEWLQNYHRQPRGQLVYEVFDILWLDGYSLVDLPLVERKKLLKSALPKSPHIHYSDHIVANGEAFFAEAGKQQLEGIMAKRAASPYRMAVRGDDWLKIKTHLRQEVVIGGFTEPQGSRQYIGALILGVYQDGEFHYVGHTGGGIPTDQLQSLHETLVKLERQSSPFMDQFKPNSTPHWVTPKLVCEVQFGEWTADGRMRQPIFMGLRPDKPAKEVHIEMPKATARPTNKPLPQSRHVQFTHPDKVFWPEKGYTKGDLIAYYDHIAPVMLPYLKDRPMSMLRQPDGYKGFSFFQKDIESSPAWARTTKIYSESNHKDVHYLVCDSKDALLYMAQLGCIEINPWSSRLDHLDKPDWAVIDLDPEGVNFEDVITVARTVHAVCEELHLPSYPKTSGKTGIHIFIPLHAAYTYDQAQQFAHLLVTLIHERVPELTSLERSPEKRRHKIYLDYLQNSKGQTLASAYSVRPTHDASVSTPLHWDEVKKGLRPEQFTMFNIEKRLAKVGDLWKPVLGKGVDIAKILKHMA